MPPHTIMINIRTSTGMLVSSLVFCLLVSTPGCPVKFTFFVCYLSNSNTVRNTYQYTPMLYMQFIMNCIVLMKLCSKHVGLYIWGHNKDSPLQHTKENKPMNYLVSRSFNFNNMQNVVGLRISAYTLYLIDVSFIWIGSLIQI